MSKWSTYRKRSGSRYLGSLPGPGSADWDAQPGAVNFVAITLERSEPPGVTYHAVQYRLTSTQTWGAPVITLASQYDLNAGAPGVEYAVRIAWSDAAVPTTEWSDVKVAVSGS